MHWSVFFCHPQSSDPFCIGTPTHVQPPVQPGWAVVVLVVVVAQSHDCVVVVVLLVVVVHWIEGVCAPSTHVVRIQAPSSQPQNAG